MNWDDLRIFLSVARESSLTGAARALRIDPATVGRRVARLEEEMDAVLFVKSPQGYRATPAGELLLERAEDAESAVHGAVADLSGEKERLTGTIRLGAPDGCAIHLLPAVTKEIQDENPGLDIQIVALPRIFNLSKREADMAIAVSPPRTGRLTVQKIADYGLCLAAAKSYLERHNPIQSPDDLHGHVVIGYIPDLIFDRELDYLAELGITRVDLASNLVTMQLAWIRAGAGLGVVHDFVLPDVPQIVPILPQTHRLRRTFWLVRHADDTRIERLNRFAETLTEKLRAALIAAETQV